MTFLRTAVCLLLLGQAALAQRLISGVPFRFTIPAQSQAATVTGLSVVVPPGSIRLTIDLKADVPSNTLFLWARFDREITVDGGLVTASDYSAQVQGSGTQQLVITPANDVPLQTGTYHLAIGVATFNSPISGTLTATVQGGGTGGTFVISTFERDSEDWGRNYPGSLLPGASPGGDQTSALVRSNTGGAPGGYLQMTDDGGPFQADNQDFAVAPGKFLGNLGALPNARLDFDYQRFVGPPATFPLRLVVIGTDSAFQWVSSDPPEGGWNHFRIDLNTNTLKRAAGTAPLGTVLSNVQRIELSMDQAFGGMREVNGLDNFALSSDLPPPPPATQPVPAVPVLSTFDNGCDDWTRNYPPAGIPGSTVGDGGSNVSCPLGQGKSGGSLDGGLVLAEAGGDADDYFVAPAKFLGNIGAIPFPRLEFDYRHIPLNGPGGVASLVVRLLGAGSSYIWQGAPPGALGQWQHFAVPLGQAFFIRESGTATFAQVLAAVTRLEISADQIETAETDVLDNVRLFSAAAPPVQPQLQFSPAILTFTAPGDGSSPAPQSLRITSSGDSSSDAGGPLNWTAQLDPNAPWLTLSQTTGITPTVITVTANAAGLAARTYSAVLTVTAIGASNSPQSFTISLTVLPPPTAQPRLDGVVNAASFRGPLAAGTLASAFGINFGGTAAGESTGFLPNTTDLPRIFRGVRVVLRDGGTELGSCPLLFLKNDQINFQLNYEVASRSAVQIVVENNGVQSAPLTVTLASNAPGLFTYGSNNHAAVQNQDYSLNGSNNAALRGSTIIAYLTGPGVVAPDVATGHAAPNSPLSSVPSSSSATIGGVGARVAFLGLTPGFVGLVQANIEVAAGTPIGEQLLFLSVGSQSANAAIVSIK
jgi:uncharacterized protein (TIGR03437 family)